VPLLLNRSRSFLDLRAASRDALKEGCCAVGVDSVSHFWQDLFTEGMKARGPRLQRIGRIKEEWAPFAQDFQDSEIHYLITGRMGFVWDEVEMPDEKGEMVKELSKGGTKIKAEGDFGHEPDLEIETAQLDDPDLVRFDKVGGRARRNFKSQMIHVATVKKCRVWSLNGKAFTYKDQPVYKPDYYKKVAEPFQAYFESINIGGAHAIAHTDRGSSSVLFETGDERSKHEYQLKRDAAFEKWDATMVSLGASGTGKAETKMRMILGEKITGTRSKTEFGQQSLQDVMRHVSTLMQAERLIKNTGVAIESWAKPEYDEKLDELVKLARADWEELSFVDAWAPKLLQPGVVAIDQGREEIAGD
jgi:hypothetical protein